MAKGRQTRTHPHAPATFELISNAFQSLEFVSELGSANALSTQTSISEEDRPVDTAWARLSADIEQHTDVGLENRPESVEEPAQNLSMNPSSRASVADPAHHLWELIFFEVARGVSGLCKAISSSSDSPYLLVLLFETEEQLDRDHAFLTALRLHVGIDGDCDDVWSASRSGGTLRHGHTLRCTGDITACEHGVPISASRWHRTHYS